MRKALMSWSSGKDSAWALHVIRQRPGVEVVGLYSVMDGDLDRVPMHRTHTALLRRQAEAVGLPLELVYLPEPYTEQDWDAVMRRFVDGAVAAGIQCIAFGDLFLEDVRRRREVRLADTGIQALFPLWDTPTGDLARDMFAAGVEAWVCSVDLAKLPAEVAGRRWSPELLQEFENEMDPCGEFGEIHTFVTDGPMFERPVKVKIGQTQERDGFAHCDIVPVDGEWEMSPS